MRALVFEQWQGGHYFNYLECLVPRLASICDEVVVAITGVAAASPQFAEQLSHLRQLPNVRFDTAVTVPSGTSRLLFRMNLGRNVVEAIERNRPDCVFLPSADEQVLALPLHALVGRGGPVRKTHLEAVIHYKGYTARDSGSERMISALQCQLLRLGVFNRLNFVNFLQYEDAVERGLPWARSARAAGDPVPQPARIERVAARRELGLDPAGRYVGMVGGLDQRKAVPATLAAFRAAALGRGDRLLLAGKMDAEYVKLVADDYQDLVRDGRLVVLDRFLSARELACGFAALDVHVSVYRGFTGLSSLTLKSLAAGVPVVANDFGWVGAVTKRFEVGRAVDLKRPADYASAFHEALDASPSYSETAATRRLLDFHSVDNFTAGLVEEVAVLAGKPVQAPILPWSWVLEALPPERRRLR